MKYFQLLPLLAGAASALTSAQWRSQSIYQVITDRYALTNGSTTQPCSLGSYCGGTWQGLINKLDYIQGMGFTAVWISPVVKNLANSAYGNPYHGYWAQDIYQLNPAFGTAADLKALSSALHSRGMYLMVDVVANHMAYSGNPASVKYSSFNPFNDQSYYHPYCAIDYSNTTSAQQCWMGDTVVSLPDLRTEDPAVQTGFQTWIKQLVANYSIDGLRLDSAMQTNQAFWPGFISASGVYAVGEVLDGNPNTLCAWQSYMPGVLNYASYFWLIRAFQSTSSTMTELANNVQWLSSVCGDVTLLGNFAENHDNARFASITTDVGLTQNVIAFTTLNDGIPILYYGQEQGFNGASDPNNREPLWTSAYNTKAPMYAFVAKLNAARKLAIAKSSTYVTTKSKVIYSDSKVMVTSKAGLISLFTDNGASVSGSITIAAAKSGFAANTKFTDLLTCNVLTTDGSGNLAVSIVSGAPRALYLTSALSGSDVCASSNSGSVVTSSAAKSTSAQTSTSKTSSSTLPSTTKSATTANVSTSTKTTSSQTSTSKTSSSTLPSTTKPATTANLSTSTKTTSSAVSTSAAASSAVKPVCPSGNGTSYITNGKTFVLECGLDHSGGDLKMVYVANFQSCIDTCATTDGCVDVSLSGTACYMKSKVGATIYNGVNGARLPSTAATPASTTTTSPPKTATTSLCTIATNVAVTFKHNVTTAWGESVDVVGSIAQLGTWNASQAAWMSSTNYPIWNFTLTLPAGTYFEYKFVKATAGGVTWEADPNRNYTVLQSCSTSATLSGSWQQ